MLESMIHLLLWLVVPLGILVVLILWALALGLSVYEVIAWIKTRDDDDVEEMDL